MCAIPLMAWHRHCVLRARRPVCLRSRRSNERGAISGRENHRPRRLASSCVKRFITSGKASTVRDQPSRRSRSRSRKRGVQASNSVVHRPAPSRRPNRAPSTRAVQRDIAADIQGVGPEPSVVRSGGKAEKRLRARRWHVRPGARRDIVPRGHAGQPHVKPYGRKDRVSVERRRAKRHEPASDAATTPRHRWYVSRRNPARNTDQEMPKRTGEGIGSREPLTPPLGPVRDERSPGPEEETYERDADQERPDEERAGEET